LPKLTNIYNLLNKHRNNDDFDSLLGSSPLKKDSTEVQNAAPKRKPTDADDEYNYDDKVGPQKMFKDFSLVLINFVSLGLWWWLPTGKEKACCKKSQHRNDSKKSHTTEEISGRKKTKRES